MKYLIKNSALIIFGGLIYALMEILWRGWTKPVMILIGGVAFLAIYHINTSLNIKNRFLRAFVCAVCVTLIEFSSGVIVNIWLKMGVWDYSSRFMNFLGQICPFYFFVWFFISLFAEKICFKIKKIFG